MELREEGRVGCRRRGFRDRGHCSLHGLRWMRDLLAHITQKSAKPSPRAARRVKRGAYRSLGLEQAKYLVRQPYLNVSKDRKFQRYDIER